MSLRSGSPRPRKSGLARALSLCCIFTLLSTIAFTVWFHLTSGYTAVLKDSDVELIQLDEPKAGDPIVIMHTDAGDMTYRLFPDECPVTVSSFKSLCESGYYDGTYVFRVEKDIFFSAGSPEPDGSLPEGASSTAAESVLRELSPKLWPLRGALCALTSKQDAGFLRTLTGTQQYFTGSRFLVCDTIEMTDEIIEGLQSQTGENMKKIGEAFVEHGGIPNYSQQISVFGQLIDGFDVLDAITGTELTGEQNAMRPTKDIRILSMEYTAFG